MCVYTAEWHHKNSDVKFFKKRKHSGTSGHKLFLFKFSLARQLAQC